MLMFYHIKDSPIKVKVQVKA